MSRELIGRSVSEAMCADVEGGGFDATSGLAPGEGEGLAVAFSSSTFRLEVGDGAAEWFTLSVFACSSAALLAAKSWTCLAAIQPPAITSSKQHKTNAQYDLVKREILCKPLPPQKMMANCLMSRLRFRGHSVRNSRRSRPDKFTRFLHSLPARLASEIVLFEAFEFVTGEIATCVSVEKIVFYGKEACEYRSSAK